MKKIGSYLKEVREKRSYSQAMVEEGTKIPIRYIQAIEEGDFSILPGRAYIIGFIRTYAKFLQVDSDELIDYYREIYPDEEEEMIIYKTYDNEHQENYHDDVDIRQTYGNLHTTPIRKLNVKRLILAIVIVAAIVVVLLVVFAKGAGNGTEVNLPQNPVTQTDSNNNPNQDATNIDAVASPLTVKVMATAGSCDLSVETDSEDNVTNLTLEQGMQISFTADEYMKIHYSKAASVTVEVNGQKQEAFAADATEIDKIYTVEDFQQQTEPETQPDGSL